MDKNEFIINKIKNWINCHYAPEDCGLTPESSRGNYDDVFQDGASYGMSWAAWDISCLLEMGLEEPKILDEDESGSEGRL